MSGNLFTSFLLKVLHYWPGVLIPALLLAPLCLLSQEADTLSVRVDTVSVQDPEGALDARVVYDAHDSVNFDFNQQKVYLYGDARIDYKEITLTADYIMIDLSNNTLFAKGLPDSAGVVRGKPVFTEKGQSFKAETIRYNYKTRKGLIEGVATEDGYGYLAGSKVKKMGDDNLNIASGYYTTCNLEQDPHFAFRYNKSKVVPGKRIVTGPAYLEIEGMPTPLAVPFGWFPSEQGKKNGIIIPTYGESNNRGFYFENFGYYFAVADYFDMRIVGDIYSRGSWAVKPTMRYRKRYKFIGDLNFSYAINLLGERETPSFERNRDFMIRWNHRQDKAARPKSDFSANVNIKSSNFNRFNPTSTEDYLSNTFRSSIAYQTRFGDFAHLTLNAGHDQNTQTKVINVSLPEVSFTVNRFYPFRSSKRVGKQRWYDKISANYSMSAINRLSSPDSTFLEMSTLKAARNGIRHTMPVNSPVQLLKFITWTNSLNFTDRMYFESYRKYWSNDTIFLGNDTIVGYEVTDTLSGFRNAFDFNFSSSLSTRIYGMFNFGRKFPVNAIRHVFTPSVSFSYTPDFGSPAWGYYESYTRPDGREVEYSVFQGSVYGSPPSRNSGRVGVSLKNNLEMKVRSRSDTITGTKKVVLIEDFTISGYYDLARDSLNLSNISMSGRTTLFRRMTLQYRSSWDPYVLDSTGTRNLNKFEWTENKRLLRLDNTNWSLSFNYRLNSKDLQREKPQDEELITDAGTEAEREEIAMNPEEYIDWSIPWDVNLSYTFNYTSRHLYPEGYREIDRTVVQTLGLSGNVSVTPKWKVGFRTGWDFESGDLSYTSISVYRDLHCWEMRFNWIPTGFRQSWNFSINAKASILQDLKLTKKKDFRDF